MLKVEINWLLIESLLAKWDVTDRFFRFFSIEMCPTIKEYSRIVRVEYNTKFIVAPPLNQGFESRTSEILGIKKDAITKGMNKQMWFQSSMSLFTSQDAYKKKKKLAFLSSIEEWSQNQVLARELAIPDHVFPRNLDSIDTGL